VPEVLDGLLDAAGAGGDGLFAAGDDILRGVELGLASRGLVCGQRIGEGDLGTYEVEAELQRAEGDDCDEQEEVEGDLVGALPHTRREDHFGGVWSW
jgi:hypothetical protein